MSEHSPTPDGFQAPQSPPPSAQNSYQAPPPQQYHQPMPPQEPKGMAIAALVLGILAIVFALVPLIAFPLGALAVIFGVISLRRNTAKGMSIAGLITGSLGLLFTVIVFVFTFLTLQALNETGEITLELGDEIERSLEEQQDEFQAEVEALDIESEGV